MGRRLPTALAALAFALLSAAVLWVAAGPILTDDLWWHLAMGEFYATHGPFATGDPLLHTAHAHAPIPHEWLFGVLVHVVERGFSLPGLRAVHALLVLGILGLALALFRRQSAAWAEALVAASVFLALSWFRLFQLRPDLVSIPATLLLFWLLVEPETPVSRRRLAAAVALLVVWANLHSLFALAFPLLGAALGGMLVRAALARRRGEPEGARLESRRAGRLAAALGIGLVASGANPRGFSQHLTFFTSSTGSAIWRVFDEWTPFDPLSPVYVQGVSPLSWALTNLVLLAFVGIAAFGGWRLLRSGNAREVWRFDPVLAALGLASLAALLVSIRFLWMTIFPLLFVLRVANGTVAGSPRRASKLAWSAAVASVFLLALWPRWSQFPLVASNLPLSGRAWLGQPYVPWKYHAVGVRFLRETGFRGNLFNPYEMGGFLAYWLGPDVRTFIDGRTEHYPPQVFEDALRIASRRGREPGQRLTDLLESRGVDLFFGVGFPSPDTRPGAHCTTEHLAGAPGWILVSRSVHHALYLRVNPRNRDNLQRIASWYAAQGVPFDSRRGLDPVRVIRERPAWAAANEMLPGPDAERGGAGPATRFASVDALARIHALLGSFDAQLALEREALALRPDAKDPRRRLVYALLRTGAPERALTEVRRLRARDPADPLSAAAERSVRRFLEATRRTRRSPRLDALPPEVFADLFPLLSRGDAAWLRTHFYHTRLDAGL